LIASLPAGVRQVVEPGEVATALVFADDVGSLRGTLAQHRDRDAQSATFWVAYPKAKRITINCDTLWPILVAFGMRPIGQVAINEVWSALQFRPTVEGEAPLRGGRLPTKHRGGVSISAAAERQTGDATDRCGGVGPSASPDAEEVGGSHDLARPFEQRRLIHREGPT